MIDDGSPMGGLYTVRIVVDGIKQQMLSKLTDVDGTLRATLEKEMEAAVERFNPEAEIPGIADEVVSKFIPKLIRETIEDSCREVFRSQQWSDSLYKIMLQSLKVMVKDREAVGTTHKNLYTFLLAKLATGQPVTVTIKRSKNEYEDVLLGVSKSFDSNDVYVNIADCVENADVITKVDRVPIEQIKLGFTK